MGMTDVERRTLKAGTQVALATPNIRGPPDPIAVRIPEAILASGLSRSELYRRAGRGEVVIVKAGRSSLVLFHSLRAAIEALPRASIRPEKIPTRSLPPS
jgi:hypothetical protein